MNWHEGVEIVVANTGVERYRWLCSDENEDAETREGYRSLVVALASRSLADGNPGAQYPSVAEQAGNAAKAAGRVVSAVARGKKVLVDRQEQDRRLAICQSCEYFDSPHKRCRKCGCFASAKNWLATEKCPIGRW